MVHYLMDGLTDQLKYHLFPLFLEKTNETQWMNITKYLNITILQLKNCHLKLLLCLISVCLIPHHAEMIKLKC
jgi:hypothetical protein